MRRKNLNKSCGRHFFFLNPSANYCKQSGFLPAPSKTYFLGNSQLVNGIVLFRVGPQTKLAVPSSQGGVNALQFIGPLTNFCIFASMKSILKKEP